MPRGVITSVRADTRVALTAAGSAALLFLGFALSALIFQWSQVAGICTAFLGVTATYVFLSSRIAAVSRDDGASFAVYRQAFGVLESYLNLSSDDDRLFFKELLDRVLMLADAEFGFVGVVLYDDEGKPFLRTRWISDIAWNEASRAAFSPQGMEFSNLDTLFGYTLRTGEHLLTNAPDQHVEAGGFPPGHPPVTSYLGVPLKSGGELVGMVGLGNRPGGFSLQHLRNWQVFFDISAEIVRHSRLQSQLDGTRKRYQQLFQEAPLMYLLTDSTLLDEDGPRVRACNAAFLNRLGYTEAEVVGRPVGHFYDDYSRRMLLEGGYSKALQGGIDNQARTLISRNGDRIATLLKAVPVTDDEGEPVGTQAMFLDISELTIAREHGRNLEFGFRRLLNSANSLIVEVDEASRTMNVSAGMMRLLRYRERDHSSPDFLSLIVGEETRKLVRDTVKQVVTMESDKSATRHSYEVSVKTRYGDTVALRIDVDRLIIGRGQTSAWIVAQDITHSQTMARLDAERQRAESLTRLTGNIAHEFNNILTIVRSNIRVLGDQRAALEEKSAAAKDARGAVSEAAELTQTLLAYSGQQLLRPSVILLDDVIEALAARWRLKVGQGLEIKVLNYLHGNYCRLDQTKLDAVLDELVKNAVEASGASGQIEIGLNRVKVTSFDRNRFPNILPGSYLVVSIADFGQGIPAELLSKVRDPFFSTKNYRGLGLSNASGILKQSGGELFLESKECVGTAASIWLPDDVYPRPQQLSDFSAQMHSLSGSVKLATKDEGLARHISEILEHSAVMLDIVSDEDLASTDVVDDVFLLDSALGDERCAEIQSQLPDRVSLVKLCHPLADNAGIVEFDGSVDFPVTSVGLINCLEGIFNKNL